MAVTVIGSKLSWDLDSVSPMAVVRRWQTTTCKLATASRSYLEEVVVKRMEHRTYNSLTLVSAKQRRLPWFKV